MELQKEKKKANTGKKRTQNIVAPNFLNSKTSMIKLQNVAERK